MTASSSFAPEGYTLVREIGRGAGSVVWEARRPVTGAPVALTILDPDVTDPAAVRAFERACAAAAVPLRHPNVLRVLDAGPRDTRPWLATELCRRGSLAAQVAARGPLEVPTGLRVLARLADAMVAARAAGLVHGAVTPTDVLLTDSGEPALGGFAPVEATEPANGGPRADVLSLGATVWELLAGQAPFSRCPLPPSELIPDDLLALLGSMTDPDLRPATMVEVREAVGALARDRGIDLGGPAWPPLAVRVDAPTQVIAPVRVDAPTQVIDRARLRTTDGWSSPLPAEQVLSFLPPRAAGAKSPYGADPETSPLYTTPTPFRPRADDEEPARRRRLPLVAATVLAVLLAVGTVFGLRQGSEEPAPVLIAPAAATPTTTTAPPETTTQTTSATPTPSTRATTRATTTRPRATTTRPVTPTTRVPRPATAEPTTRDEPAPEPTRSPTEAPDPGTSTASDPVGGTTGG